jgi:hypothetical protein
MKFDFYLVADFRKSLNYEVSSKSVQWELSCFMLTDGHGEANGRFFQSCQRA